MSFSLNESDDTSDIRRAAWGEEEHSGPEEHPGISCRSSVQTKDASVETDAASSGLAHTPRHPAAQESAAHLAGSRLTRARISQQVMQEVEQEKHHAHGSQMRVTEHLRGKQEGGIKGAAGVCESRVPSCQRPRVGTRAVARKLGGGTSCARARARGRISARAVRGAKGAHRRGIRVKTSQTHTGSGAAHSRARGLVDEPQSGFRVLHQQQRRNLPRAVEAAGSVAARRRPF